MRLSATESEVRRNGVTMSFVPCDVDRRRERKCSGTIVSPGSVCVTTPAMGLCLLCELNVTQDCNAAVCTVYKRFVTAVRRANAN